MEWWQIVLVVALLVVVLTAVAAFVLWRRASEQTRALSMRLGKLSWRARFKLAWRLTRDDRVPLRGRVIPPLLVLYLATPIDLVPDFIPILGQLDDVVVLLVGVGLILRFVTMDVIESHIQALEAEAAAV